MQPSFQSPRYSQGFSSTSLGNQRTWKTRKAAWSKEGNFVLSQGTSSESGTRGCLFTHTAIDKNHDYLLEIWHCCSYIILPDKRSNAKWYNVFLQILAGSSGLRRNQLKSSAENCNIERGGKDTRDCLLLISYV